MFRGRIVRAIVGVAIILGLTTACGGELGGSSDTAGQGSDTSSSAAANPTAEAAAKAAADALAPTVQAMLQGYGFKNVKVTSEMEEEGGQSFAVVSALVGLDQLKSGCALNYETRVTNLKLYFDEVITPQKPEGIEVKGDARNSVSPKSGFGYVLKNHPACLVPNAKAPTS